MTLIDGNLKVFVCGDLFIADDNAEEIADQITALLWDLA